MSTAGSARRRVPRRLFESPVGLLVHGNYSVERSFQVGEGGIMVSSKMPLEIGHQLVASFFLKGKTMIVRGIVRNTLPAKGHLPIRYGLEFVNLEFQYKREIRNFVASASNMEGEI
jgi:hypothetical protein